MANTVRDMAIIETLLADNNSGDISPQDVRDAIESLRPSSAVMHITTPAATTFGAAGSPVAAAGTTALNTSLARWSSPANNQLQLNLSATGGASPDRLVKVTCTLSGLPSAAGKNMSFYLAKGPVGLVTTLSETRVRQHFSSMTQYESVCLTWAGLHNEGEILQLYVANDTDTTSFTVTEMAMVAVDYLS